MVGNMTGGAACEEMYLYDKERQSHDRRIKAPVLKDEFINRLQEVLERKTMAGIQSCVRLLQKSRGKVTRSEKDLRR